MNSLIVVAPHPDDETLGCGGTLLKLKKRGVDLHWLIGTTMSAEMFDSVSIKKRKKTIKKVQDKYGFQSIHMLDLPAAMVDTIPISKIHSKIKAIFSEVKPETVFLPFGGDVHSDHQIIFEVGYSCTKWFRNEFINTILLYETISETEFGHSLDGNYFKPNLFSDITENLDRKIEILNCYQEEMGDFPFPRSEKTVRSLANYRGSTVGFSAAEAFMQLKSIL